MPAESPDPRRPRAPELVRVAALIVLLQGIALTLTALGYGVWAGVSGPKHTGLAAGTAVVVVVFGVVLLFAARGLAGGARVSFSPIVLIELLMLPVAWGMAQASQWAICAALAVPALVVLAILFSPQGRGVAR